jgi:RNA polymerase sigma factor (sigma-70 family)
MVDTVRTTESGEPDPIRTYLARIAAVPLLTAEQEVDLAKRIEAGVYAAELLCGDGPLPGTRAELAAVARAGERARKRMIQANLRLVVAEAGKWTRSGMPLVDLIQEGNLGLIHAVEKFDYKRGNKFSTYAMWWIRQAIRRGIATQVRTIRLPGHAEETLSALDRVAMQARLRHGRELPAAELAKLAGVPTERVIDLMRYRAGTISLDTPVGDGAGSTLGDFVEDSDAALAFEAVEQRALAAELRALVDALPKVEADAILMRFGLLDGEPWTLREIGKNMGLSTEGARLVVRRGLARLRRTGWTTSPRAA